MSSIIIGIAFIIMLGGGVLLLYLSFSTKRGSKRQNKKTIIQLEEGYEGFDNLLLGQSIARSTKNNTGLNTTGFSSSMMDTKICPMCVATNGREEQTCKRCGHKFEDRE